MSANSPGSTESTSRTERAIEELIADNRRRRVVRRRIGLFSLPLVLLALALVVKLVSMFTFAHFSLSAYADGNGEGATSAAAGQLPVNWFEPYKAPFNQGDGYVLSAKLPDARERFETALDLARGLEECVVRVNLSLTIEMQGDAADATGDHDAAQKFYLEALAVTADTPEECHSDAAQEQSTDQSRDMGDTIDENRQRQQEKAQPDEQQQQPAPQPTPSETPQQEQPSPGDLDEIQKQLEQGQQERDDREGGGSGGADKPW